MRVRLGVVLVALSSIASIASLGAVSCKDPDAPRPPPTHEEPPVRPPPPPPVATHAPPPVPTAPAPGTRTVLASKSGDDTWDKMIVAGGRLWVLTNVTRWTTGPMYVPTARLWSVPIGGGELTKHLDLEGMGSLTADDGFLYVAVTRNLSSTAPRTGRILRLPLAGGAPTDIATGLEPRVIAVDGDTLWVDDTRLAKDGSKSAIPTGAKGAMTFAFDADNVYFTTAKGAGPAGDVTGARVFRMPKKGGPPAVIAAKLPDEATGLAVDATHVYFCAVGWSSPAIERAGIVGPGREDRRRRRDPGQGSAVPPQGVDRRRKRVLPLGPRRAGRLRSSAWRRRAARSRRPPPTTRWSMPRWTPRRSTSRATARSTPRHGRASPPPRWSASWSADHRAQGASAASAAVITPAHGVTLRPMSRSRSPVKSTSSPRAIARSQSASTAAKGAGSPAPTSACSKASAGRSV